jgi:hypothetical protein
MRTSYFQPPARKNAVLVECQERPGVFLSIAQASDLAGYSYDHFTFKLRRQAFHHGTRTWAEVNGLHFRRVPREEIPEPGEATPPASPSPARPRATWKPLAMSSPAPAPAAPVSAPPITQPATHATHESRPRVRRPISAINAHVVGRAAIHVPED